MKELLEELKKLLEGVLDKLLLVSYFLVSILILVLIFIVVGKFIK